MNKFLIILIIIGLRTSSFAQYHKLDSAVHTIKGAQFIASQKYNPNSKKAEVIRYERAKATEAIQKVERMQVEFDDRGNDVGSLFSTWNPESKTWDDEEKTDKEFNAENKLIRNVTHRKRDNKWIKVFENIKTYSQDSIIDVGYEIREGGFQPTHKTVTVVNSFDKIKTNEIFHWNDEKQNLQQLIRTENWYQKDTILIASETFGWDTDGQNQEKIVYELDENQQLTRNYTRYKGKDGQWIPNYRFEYVKLPNEQRELNITYTWIEPENNWQKNSEVVRFLDKQDKEMGSSYSEYNQTTKQLSLAFEVMNLYDNLGRLKLSQNITHNGTRMTGSQSTVKFDDAGNVIRETQFKFDTENDTWVEIMSTELSYNINMENGKSSIYPAKSDLFGLSEFNYIKNKNVPTHVKVYTYQNGEKVLSEEFEYFYSLSK